MPTTIGARIMREEVVFSRFLFLSRFVKLLKAIFFVLPIRWMSSWFVKLLKLLLEQSTTCLGISVLKWNGGY
jgi:hypothetical protein